MRRHPLLYEINTWAWLNSLSARLGERITLATVPDAVIDEIAGWGFDAIWLMGVWTRSPFGRRIAQTLPGLHDEYTQALPDWTPDDVAGSPYAIFEYAVDPALGGRDGLAAIRARFARHGIKLILDYVPNHVAVDHHWTVDAPAALVQGTAGDLVHHPGFYYQTPEGRVFANGRDPNYPAWTDTAQVDAFSPTAREWASNLLLDIASQCDGVRCDMAMLMTSRIFERTWRHTERLPHEFWDDVIPAVRAKFPDFVFAAEVYWEMEGEMLALGFDYAYDKRLYDRMRDQGADQVRDHLLAGLDYQTHMLRFIENHDEKRAAKAFAGRDRAAAVLTTLLPGARMLHEGQFEGWRRKLPVQLGRRSPEATDESLYAFYRTLVGEAGAAAYHQGVYMALGANPILSNDPSHDDLIAFAWVLENDWRVVAVNFSHQPIKARLILPNPAWYGAYKRTFVELFSGAALQIAGDDLLTRGLELTMDAFEARVFRLG